jgi:D-proline reductase (dithiol) PrdB
VSLGARQIEEAGIPTVVIGSARDIVEECGVPRFVFVDFPLGNPCGKPDEVAMQHSIVGLALDSLEKAFAPRTTVQAPVRWDDVDPDGWRERFMHVGDDNRQLLADAGAERKRLQEEIRQRDTSTEPDREG